MVPLGRKNVGFEMVDRVAEPGDLLGGVDAAVAGVQVRYIGGAEVNDELKGWSY